MPALGEIGRRRFLYALSGFGVSALTSACNISSPEPIFKPTYVPSTTTDEFPKPPENPNPTPEPIKAAPALPTSTRTPRAGPLPTVDIPELRRTPVAESTPKATTKPTEIPTPTPQPENEDPLSFSVLWEKEVPFPRFVPQETVFSDSDNSYLIIDNKIYCFSNEGGKGWGPWPINNTGLEHPEAIYDKDFLFTKYLGNLQVSSNRLTAPTIIQGWDKKSGNSIVREWAQPLNGNQQFFFHDGVIERLLIPGGTIETTFEVWSKRLGLLWMNRGRILYTNERAQIVVFNTSPGMKAFSLFVTNLQTGENRKLVLPPELGEFTISGYYFEGVFMWMVKGNVLLKIDLRDPQSKPISIPNIGGDVYYRHNTSNNPNLYMTNGRSNVVICLDKETGRDKWRRYTGDQSIALMGERAGVVLARVSDSNKVLLFDVHTGDMSEVQDKVPQFDEILGSYKETVVVQGKTQNNTGVWGIDVQNRRLKFSYRGHTVRAAVSGRALVFSLDYSNKLSVIDIETGKETVHTMKGEVDKIIAPKSRFFLVQTSRPKGFLTAIKV